MATFYQFTEDGYLESVVKTTNGIPQGRYQVRYDGLFNPLDFIIGGERVSYNSGSQDLEIWEPTFHNSDTVTRWDIDENGDDIEVEYPVQTGWRKKPGSNSIKIPPEDIFFTGSIG